MKMNKETEDTYICCRCKEMKIDSESRYSFSGNNKKICWECQEIENEFRKKIDVIAENLRVLLQESLDCENLNDKTLQLKYEKIELFEDMMIILIRLQT